MNKEAGCIFFLFCLAAGNMAGQDSYFRPGFARAVMINPSLSGAEGDGNLRMSYTNFLPGNNFGLHSASLSFDLYSDFLHGGMAVFTSSDLAGDIFSYSAGGISYAYHLKAGRELYIYGGLGAAVRHTGINRSRIVMPDQIDPLEGKIYPTGDMLNFSGRTFFDVSTGFTAIYRNYAGALSVNNLARPAEAEGSTEGYMARRMTLIAWAEYNIDRNKNYKIKPVVFLDLSGSYLLLSGHAVLAAGPVAVNAGVSASSTRDIDMRAGIAFRVANVSLLYNYCFNMASYNRSLPFTISHEGGISLSLNHVNKSSRARTINFPEL